MIVTRGRDRALLALTAAWTSSYVPMFYMEDEYGETGPILLFEDYSDPIVIGWSAEAGGRRTTSAGSCQRVHARTRDTGHGTRDTGPPNKEAKQGLIGHWPHAALGHHRRPVRSQTS